MGVRGTYLVKVNCSMETLCLKQTRFVHSVFLASAQEEPDGFSLKEQASELVKYIT